jgi:hypothetical protein
MFGVAIETRDVPDRKYDHAYHRDEHQDDLEDIPDREA